MAFAKVEQVLYRDHYFDFNVRHFHEVLVREHDVTLSYSWVKAALQTAGLVAVHKPLHGHDDATTRRPLPGVNPGAER